MEIYYQANDNRLRVRGVKGLDGVAIEAAIVRVTALKDPNDDDVTGVELPIVLSADAGAAGDYSVVLADLDVEVGSEYRATIEVDHAGKHGEGQFRFKVKQRRA